MSLNILASLFASRHSTAVTQATVHMQSEATLTPAQQYRYLLQYYYNVGLYYQQRVANYEDERWTPAMHGLRTAAYRVVEFYVSKLWPGTLPGALPIITDRPAIIAPIEQVWTWSNWGNQKQIAARWLAIYGDLFIKVVMRADGSRVYFQLLDPQYVTDFDTDERGYLTYARIDIPQAIRTGDKVEARTLTEVWDKASQTMRRWLHDLSAADELDRLGVAEEFSFAQFGIDFVPIVYCKFKDVGDKRGMNAFLHALDKMDEANMQATRLHQMLFRHNSATWVLSANAMDASGRPLPPPVLPGGSTSAATDANTVTVGDERMYRLPGMSKLDSLVPPINYDAALNILNAMVTEIERDLPELAYYKLRDMGEISGRAVRLLLSDAIDRLLEVRGNAESALIRANQMALTIGQNAGLPQFRGIGSYDNGDFEHTFADREVIPISDVEEAQAVQTLVTAGVPLRTALRRAGWPDEQIDDMAQDAAPVTPLERIEVERAELDLQAERANIQNQDTIAARIVQASLPGVNGSGSSSSNGNRVA